MKVVEGKTKKCGMCLEVKPLDQFHKKNTTKDGRITVNGVQGRCKECVSLLRRGK